MYVFTLLFIFGGIRYVGALRSRLFLSLSAAISQSERYTTHIFSFKPLLFYCRRPSLSLLSLRRSSSSGSSFSGSFSHERTIENSVEGRGGRCCTNVTRACEFISFTSPLYHSLSLSFCYIPSPCCPPPGPSPSSLSSGPSSTSPSGSTESFSSPSSPGCSPPRSPAPRPPP